MNNKTHNLPKTERVHLKTEIDALFKSSIPINQYPFRLLITLENNTSQSIYKAMFIAPRRKLHLAVNRNKVKRKMKEAYRLHKHLLPTPNKTVLLAFIYQQNDAISFAETEQKIILTLQRLKDYIISENIKNDKK